MPLFSSISPERWKVWPPGCHKDLLVEIILPSRDPTKMFLLVPGRSGLSCLGANARGLGLFLVTYVELRGEAKLKPSKHALFLTGVGWWQTAQQRQEKCLIRTPWLYTNSSLKEGWNSSLKFPELPLITIYWCKTILSIVPVFSETWGYRLDMWSTALSLGLCSTIWKQNRLGSWENLYSKPWYTVS